MSSEIDLSSRTRQSTIYTNGVYGEKPKVPTNFSELESRAKAAMSERAWAYIAGGAGDGETMDANRLALKRWAILPRMLRDVSHRDLSIELFGQKLPAPVLLAPVGAGEVVCPDPDVAIGEAGAELGVPYIFSSQGCNAMEDVAAAMDRVRQDAPRWFQLYWSKDDALTDSFIRRAEAIGANTLVLTLDTTQLGWRPQDLNLGSLPFTQGEGIAQYTSDPRFREIVAERIRNAKGTKQDLRVTLGAIKTLASMARHYPGDTIRNLIAAEPKTSVETFLDVFSRQSLNWDDVADLRKKTKLPIVLKGIVHPDDAKLAVEAGVEGIVVSNHGGRQIDGAISAIDALPDVVDAVDGRAKVLVDSGIRGGADVFKALALGADAVCLGRPYMYGLALDGRNGVVDVLRNVIAEFDLTLGLAGFTAPGQLSRSALRRI
ncbi:MAG: lactate 2-monooxygenase [Nocardiaceae bacterium]|nr:lactate 2-monooxygenase [Nocardiaceae bacterium]